MTRSAFSPDYQKLRRRLKNARLAAKVTQQDLARRLRKPQSYVSKYENGERRLDPIEMIRVLQALGVDPARFVHDLIS